MSGVLEQPGPVQRWSEIRRALAAQRSCETAGKAAYAAQDDKRADAHWTEADLAALALARLLADADDAGLLAEIAEYLAVTYGGRP